MQRKRRHQQGTLTKCNSAEGLYWEIRFTDHSHSASPSPRSRTRTTPGNPSRPRFRVGLLSAYPTKASASRAAQPIRDTFNSRPNHLLADRRTFGDLIDRYLAEEIPERHSTRRGYEKLIRCHIRPRWGDVAIAKVKAQDVRTWLKEIECSPRYRGHIHNMMRLLFRFGMLWEWVPAQTNPMSLFSLEGSTKRQATPGIVDVVQFQQILARVPEERFRLMLLAVMCLGLRVSELLALKWEDFDFAGSILHVRRAVVEGHVGKVKTIHSAMPLPLDTLLAQHFLRWRAHTPYALDDDWVFPTGAGENPYSASTVQTRVLIPIGKAIGLPFSLGWHTFRHSYKSWMDADKVPLTVQRDLMRHADIRTTAQVYGQVRLEDLREANSDVVLLAMGKIN